MGVGLGSHFKVSHQSFFKGMGGVLSGKISSMWTALLYMGITKFYQNYLQDSFF